MSLRSLGALAALAVASITGVGQAQQSPDTTRARSDSAQALEAVAVTAIRARDEAPISQKTLRLADIEERHLGQDIPLLLEGTPSLTIKSETGTPWGYSYIRLRGMEHRRINFTLDGIPLNDPEDHVLYFADFPDLGNSLQSVQVQRGVGTSSTGVSAYAGSVNMETISLATARAGWDAQLQTGAFASHRASVEYASGMVNGNVAFYARGSALTTNGYRQHAGVDGRSAFFSGAWFGTRDIVKLTATTGLFADTMAYTGVSPETLRLNRRFNPLRPEETDRFAERVVGVTYIRSLSPAASLSAMVYRIGANGAYYVCFDRCDPADTAPVLWKFHLDFGWYGATTAWTWERDRLRVSVGANANTYARDHYASDDAGVRQYFNTGHKQDASGFVKLARDVGALTLFGDVQARAARFRYTADPLAGVPDMAIDWAFLNPKVGLTWRLSPSLSAYGSYGINSREPAREDMFGGADNLDAAILADIGSLDRVRPERAADLEAGVTLTADRLRLQANAFDMRFRNEILPIGQLTYIYTPLRKNVASSYRRGIELDATVRVSARVEAGANATAMVSHIEEYTDRDGNTYRDVPALLTPKFQSAQRLTWRPSRALNLTAEGRYIGRSQLTNTNDPFLVLPSSYVLDARASTTVGRVSISLFGSNLGNSARYYTGNVSSSGAPRFFVLAPRNLHLQLRALF